MVGLGGRSLECEGHCASCRGGLGLLVEYERRGGLKPQYHRGSHRGSRHRLHRSAAAGVPWPPALGFVFHIPYGIPAYQPPARVINSHNQNQEPTTSPHQSPLTSSSPVLPV